MRGSDNLEFVPLTPTLSRRERGLVIRLLWHPLANGEGAGNSAGAAASGGGNRRG
jgi:hypothetical protein